MCGGILSRPHLWVARVLERRVFCMREMRLARLISEMGLGLVVSQLFVPARDFVLHFELHYDIIILVELHILRRFYNVKIG
jgi:hypothetical protein